MFITPNRCCGACGNPSRLAAGAPAINLGQGLELGRVELIGTVAAFPVTAVDVVYDDLTLYLRRNRLIGRIGNPIALQCDGTPKTYYIMSRSKTS